MNRTNEPKPLIKTAIETICAMCADKAHVVEAVIEERTYGEQFAALITGRIFYHLHADGSRKKCVEMLPNPWLFTLSSIEDADRVRLLIASLMAKTGGNTSLLKLFT